MGHNACVGRGLRLTEMGSWPVPSLGQDVQMTNGLLCCERPAGPPPVLGPHYRESGKHPHTPPPAVGFRCFMMKSPTHCNLISPHPSCPSPAPPPSCKAMKTKGGQTSHVGAAGCRPVARKLGRAGYPFSGLIVRLLLFFFCHPRSVLCVLLSSSAPVPAPLLPAPGSLGGGRVTAMMSTCRMDVPPSAGMRKSKQQVVGLHASFACAVARDV